MNPVSLAILSAVGALAVLMSLFLGTTSTTPSVSQERANALASSILSDFTQTRDAVQSMQVVGVSPNAVTYNGAQSFGASNPAAIDDANALNYTQVFSTTFGRMSARTPNPDVFNSTVAAAERIYIFRRAVVQGTGAVNVGTGAADVVMMVVGLQDIVCQHINKIIAGDSIADTISSSALAAASITGGATPALTNSGASASIGTFTVENSNGSPRTSGCVASITTVLNVGYQVLVAN